MSWYYGQPGLQDQYGIHIHIRSIPLNSKKHDELDLDNMDGQDYMKKGDPAAFLIQSGPKICLAVLEVLGFQFKGEKVTKTTATIDDLEDPDKQIKIFGQIMCLNMSSPQKESLDWNKYYMPLDINTQDKRLMYHQYVLELASVLAYPLAPTLATRSLTGSKLKVSDYPTWRIPSEQLQLALDALWDALKPESEKILGNVELLPFISNSAALPYHDTDGNESLLVKDVPSCLLSQQKHSGKDILPFYLCGKLTVLKDMQNHVGGHILCTFCESDTQDESNNQ